jgi:hypothetical protein
LAPWRKFGAKPLFKKPSSGALSGGFRIVPQHFPQFVGKSESALPHPFQHPLPKLFSRNLSKSVTKPMQ